MQEENLSCSLPYLENFSMGGTYKIEYAFYPTVSSEILSGEVLSNSLPTMTNLKSY